VVAALRASNARLRAQNAQLEAGNAELRAQLAEQAGKIARLERLISRNSGNSSMPPSTDDQPGKKPPERKPRRGGGKRNPGRQPGAPSAYLAWNDHPDTTIPHFPEGSCQCGADLAGARDLGVRYSHQVTDLPQVYVHNPNLTHGFPQFTRYSRACHQTNEELADLIHARIG